MNLDLRPLWFDKGILTILDQRELPNKEVWIRISHSEELWNAIQTLAIRGAPLLGYAGLVGVYFSLCETHSDKEWLNKIEKLKHIRPTAINLSIEVDKALAVLVPISKWNQRVSNSLTLIQQAWKSGIEECEKIAKFGCSLIQDNDGLLTHCNTGSLASLGIGTALGIIKRAYFLKKNIQVFHTETRPLLQGSRLTAYELDKCHIPAILVIDSAVSFLMSSGKIKKVIVGADRIAINGDTANKIGTLSLALAANHYHIPFYIAAPTSSIDNVILTGEDIPIELRNESEILEIQGKKIAPLATKAWNPAFDVTPKELISAFITEKGISPL